jgi:putative membrane protein
MTKTYNLKPLITTVSIVIPVVVAILYLMPKETLATDAFSFLPKVNAILNSIATILLIAAAWAVKQKKFELHKKLMLSAVLVSVLFLVSYVLYHATSESTVFGGEGTIRAVYLFILLTHIVLAIAIVPLVLVTLSRALSQKFDKHKKIARWTLPLWLYVTITGVVIYFMIAPYY